MSRLTLALALAASLYATAARAQSQAEIAAKLNEEGKDLMFAGKFAEASEKFQQAVARVPEAKYFFNLCTSRYQEGKFGEALTACNAVEKNNPDDKLKTKNAKLEQKIKDDAAAQHIDLQPVGGGGGETNTGGDPNGGEAGNTGDPGGSNGTTGTSNPGDPNGGTTTTGGTPPPGGGAPPAAQVVGRPTQNLIAKPPPQHSYVWTLGFDLYAGGGSIGNNDASGNNIYNHGFGGFRIKSDYLLSSEMKIGGEGYLQFSNTGANNSATTTQMVTGLGIVDIGLAGYKHLCPGTGRLCLTPLLGAHLALLSPTTATDSLYGNLGSYAAFGGRGELNVALALGNHYEHVLQLMLGVNLYSAVFASPQTGATAMDVGLDKGGAFVYLGVGYTYRFNTPFGQAPFVTLE